MDSEVTFYEETLHFFRIVGEYACDSILGTRPRDQIVMLAALSAAGLLPEENLTPHEEIRRQRLLRTAASAESAPVVQHLLASLDLSPGHIDLEHAIDDDDDGTMERFAKLIALIGIYHAVPAEMSGPIAVALDRNELWVTAEPGAMLELRAFAQAMLDQFKPGQAHRLRTLLDLVINAGGEHDG